MNDMTPLVRAAYEFLSQHPGPFRAYVNPMRSDGLFVGQDLPVEPYSGVCGLNGEPLLPAVAARAKVYPTQLPCDQAERLVRLLNARRRDCL